MLVQEQALQRADARIRELQDELSELQATTRKPLARSSVPSTGFLGGASHSTSVPTSGTLRKHAGDRPTAGVGFMAQAMTTAVGVAGGMLFASGITSLLSGDSASASQVANGATDSAAPTPSADQNAVAEGPQSAEHGAEDTASVEENIDVTENGQDQGGWGDFGGDIDI